MKATEVHYAALSAKSEGLKLAALGVINPRSFLEVMNTTPRRLAGGQAEQQERAAPAKASAPRREIVGAAGAGLTRPSASAGSGSVWAVSVRSSFTSPRLHSDLTMTSGS